MMDARFEKVGIPVEAPKREEEIPVIDLTKKTRAKAECLLEMACRVRSCLFGGGAPLKEEKDAGCLADDLKMISDALSEACLQLEMIQKHLGM